MQAVTGCVKRVKTYKRARLVRQQFTWLLWQWGKQVHSWDEVFDLEAQISEWKIRHP